MFLKKLEISGFKSFANKTVLEFMPACQINLAGEEGESCGITAIVGPNGSGKSNVADAIKWVMGEQSMKTLRGKKAEDIIFAGSGKKARLSSAGVTLHFDNSDKRIPLEFTEVAITRKIFRSGESEYLINGSRVRLIDVVDLLAKAGIGRGSYCVINQGMSDAILNATAAERRMILEDAAGVKQYQIKKERSLSKLKSTRENLDRIKDLVREIEPHLKNLKRQAERAAKGKDLAEKLKEKQNLLFSYLWHTFQTEKGNFSSEKNDLGIRMMNVQREVDKINDELSQESKSREKSNQRETLERELSTIREEINVWQRELVINEGRLQLEKERLERQPVIESIPVDLHYVQDKLAGIKLDQEKLIDRLKNVENLDELQDIREFARAIQRRVQDLFAEAGQGKIEKIQAVAPISEEEKRKVTELEAKIAKLKEDMAAGQENEKSIKLAIEAEAAAERAARQKFFELEKQLHMQQAELDRMKDRFNEAKLQLARIDVREEDLVNRIKSEMQKEVSELHYNGEECQPEELEREVNRLKVQLEQIGGIDPLVLDEFNETNQRFEFLTQESADLEHAIESLKTVVKEMDQKIAEIFEDAYDKINEEFTKYFRIIFGGGNAHLAKTKVKSRKSKVLDGEAEITEDGVAEDAEEAIEELKEEEKEEVGIDISACPPGKKISHLSMLSGGERSLTSIALLFSVISYNPPPFAIVDEVDAALDEANSRRLGRILKELSNHTQFIAITHNRETMRQASMLYGVTMGDDGISKILSVKLDQVGQGGKIKE